MKHKIKQSIISNRLAALLLCLVLLFAAAPLPQALAAPEDEDTGVSDTTDAGDETGGSEDGTDSGEDAGDSEGNTGDKGGTSAQTPGATNSDNVIAAASGAPATNAEAALLISPDTGMVLYEKNADERRYPASTTKIMTALLVLENVDDLSATVTAQASDFETLDADSSNAGIKEGETVSIEDLLYALMLPSANEAAYMLARHVGGSYDAFVDMMNQRAAELGCTGTHFSNPCGLHDDNHYTTARDLYKIAYAAMQDETFADIADTVQWKMTTNYRDEYLMVTTNELIRSSYQPYAYAYCKGIKTGSTSQAGNCLVSYAEYGSAKLYSVVLGCDNTSLEYSNLPSSFTDTKSLFEWGFDAFASKTLARQGDMIKSIGVDLSTDTDELVLTAKNDLVALLPSDLDVEDLGEPQITAPDRVDAPIKAGDVIGSATYSYHGITYGTVELVALTDVEMSRVLYISDRLSNFFQTAVFRIILVVLAVFVVLYILFNLTFGGMRRRNQRKNIRTRYRNTNYQRRRRR